MSSPAPSEELERRPRTLLELFLAFNSLALQGFGGVLPIAHRELVERRRWVDAEQFVELLALGQVLPGPNLVNISIILGDRWFGPRGAFAAAAGLITVPLIIVLALFLLLQSFATQPLVVGALRGMGVAAAGLVVSTAFKLSKTLLRSPLGSLTSVLIALATFALVAFLHLPMTYVLLGFGPLVILLAWWKLARIRNKGSSSSGSSGSAGP